MTVVAILFFSCKLIYKNKTKKSSLFAYKYANSTCVQMAYLDILVPAVDHDLVDFVGAVGRLGQAVSRVDLLRHLLVGPALVWHLYSED